MDQSFNQILLLYLLFRNLFQGTNKIGFFVNSHIDFTILALPKFLNNKKILESKFSLNIHIIFVSPISKGSLTMKGSDGSLSTQT